MTSYNRREFETMQQEALRRVREMQKKAQSYVNNPQPDIAGSTNTSGQREQSPKSSVNNSNKNTHNNSGNNEKSQNNARQQHRQNMANPFAQLFGSNLGGFNRYKNCEPNNKSCPPENKPPVQEHSGTPGILPKDFVLDEEKAILILLIYILYKNGADMKLILALAYLLL